MRLHRRQLLQALGLGAVAGLLPDTPSARAGEPTSPSRIVLYVQPHGHIPRAMHMPVPGGASDAIAERPLGPLARGELSPSLRPLHAFRDRLLAIEGLAHTNVLADRAAVLRAGTGDDNNHQLGVADVLTGTRALQRGGSYCTGGGRSLDQELAARLSAPGRFGSRVYGFDYIPNSVVSPFSYLGPGRPTPMVSDPRQAFDDLLGYVASREPAPDGGPRTRAQRLQSLRPSVLDAAREEYQLLAPRLGVEGRRKLDAHQDLVHGLESSLRLQNRAACDLSVDRDAPALRQFMDLVRIAFACDLTRVVTISAPVPQCPELGYPASMTFHDYAHQSVEGSPSCGQMYVPLAERAMSDLDAWHAGHIAHLLEQLDSVPEGSGTLLDHTAVVWMSELATPTHQHEDAFKVIAGGCNGFFRTGRYVRYPRTLPNPMKDSPRIGPAHNRLLVSLLQAMGQTDTTFGMTEAQADDGTTLSLRGALTELHA